MSEEFRRPIPAYLDMIANLHQQINIAHLILAHEGSLQINPTSELVNKSRFDVDQSERIPLNRPSNIVAYEGPWYWQSFQPTCVAWTIANAGLVLGQEPDKECIRYLSQVAKPDETGKIGLSMEKAVQYVNQYNAMPYRLLSLLRNKFIHDLKMPTLIENKDEIVVGIIENNISSKRYEIKKVPWSEFIDKSIQRLDSRNPIVTAVKSSEYSGKNGDHAICIAGYRIDNNGLMDLQVIDSAHGIIWIPYERIVRAKKTNCDYVAEVVETVQVLLPS